MNCLVILAHRFEGMKFEIRK